MVLYIIIKAAEVLRENNRREQDSSTSLPDTRTCADLDSLYSTFIHSTSLFRLGCVLTQKHVRVFWFAAVYSFSVFISNWKLRAVLWIGSLRLVRVRFLPLRQARNLFKRSETAIKAGAKHCGYLWYFAEIICQACSKKMG